MKTDLYENQITRALSAQVENRRFMVRVVYAQRCFDGRINGADFGVMAPDASAAELMVRSAWHPLTIESATARRVSR